MRRILVIAIGAAVGLTACGVTTSAGACLHDMSALSARDIWAVGDVHGRPVSLHWDGRAWRAVPLPSQVTDQQGVLSGIAAASPTEVWAVGATYTGDQGAKGRTPIALRWDGHGWASVAGPAIRGVFEQVAPDGHGGMLVSGDGASDTIFHYDGRGWTREHVQNGIWVTDIALVPGTAQSVAVGGCCQGWDEDTSGRVWMRR
jgi:hypothetical protein